MEFNSHLKRQVKIQTQSGSFRNLPVRGSSFRKNGPGLVRFAKPLRWGSFRKTVANPYTGSVQPRCTCGALLPEDARFCHKCGKPQFQEDIARLNAEEPKPAPVQIPEAAAQPAANGISFRNSRAVVISVIVAAAAFFLTGAAALISALLWPVVLVGAGFLAAVLYRGHSREPLSAANGARLGWMTGLWLFVVFAIAVAMVSIYIASPAGYEAVKQLQNMPQFAKMSINTPHDLLMGVLLSAIPTFFMVTVLPGLGGMLAAMLAARRGHSS
jgi:hypothetical protein